MDTDAVTRDGDSALTCACGGVDLSVVEMLVDAGVDVNIRTPAGMSAIDWVCQEGLVSIFELSFDMALMSSLEAPLRA